MESEDVGGMTTFDASPVLQPILQQPAGSQITECETSLITNHPKSRNSNFLQRSEPSFHPQFML